MCICHKNGIAKIHAPDVINEEDGVDGRYWIFVCFAFEMIDGMNEINFLVSAIDPLLSITLI